MGKNLISLTNSVESDLIATLIGQIRIGIVFLCESSEGVGNLLERCISFNFKNQVVVLAAHFFVT